jgi:endonuclease-8
MPEGHTVHRISNRFSKDFRGRRVKVVSPQGRFTGASIVTGKKLTDSQAFGKQLFLFFGQDIIRIHLGIYGKWSFQIVEDEIPQPKGQVRARFMVPELLADLRGPTACEVIGEEGYLQSLKKLGPDPIRNDVNGADKFVEKILGSNRRIAELLMDQSVVAGIGNVYRAELLFRAKLSPLAPGKKVPRELLGSIWTDATKLMPIGVRTGLMLTREGFLKGKPNLAERYYVYKRSGEDCRECGGKISMQILAGRKLYWCRRCQK